MQNENENKPIGEREKDIPIHATVKNGRLFVVLRDERIISTPIWWYPRLKDAGVYSEDIELSLRGIHFEDINEDVSVKGMLQGWKAPPYQEENLCDVVGNSSPSQDIIMENCTTEVEGLVDDIFNEFDSRFYGFSDC